MARGKALFVRCAACHSTEPDRHGLGPSLHRVLGRRVASLPGFAYSPAMLAADNIWDEGALAAYLENPQGFIKDNKMVFVGLPADEERKDMISYLKTLN